MSGKIYKLEGYGLTYYGSTTQSLGDRKSKHKSDYKTFVKNGSNVGKYGGLRSLEIIGKGDDWDIKLVEEVDDLADLLKREGFFIKNNECVNRMVAGRTRKEYYEDNIDHMKEYKAQWTKDNRESIKANYHENRDHINEVRRVRMSGEGMKEKKKEQDAKYRAENDAKIKERKNAKVPCVKCGAEISKSNMPRHMKSKSCVAKDSE